MAKGSKAKSESAKYQGDYIIPIMGPTGAGKSSFINLLFDGKERVRVGHSLDSCTTGLESVEIPAEAVKRNLPNWRPVSPNPAKLIIVDTPGFDGTSADGSEILQRVADWLAQSYGAGAKLAGVIYLQDICQQRLMLTGATKRNFEIFDKLCGGDACQSVVLGTTQWQRVPPDDRQTADAREQELRQNFWKEMISKGSTMQRVDDKNMNASPWDLVATVLLGSPMILVLGMTGVGKSTFICSAGPRHMRPTINSGLASSQAPVEEFEVKSEDGQTISLVDTPGFNDTDKPDRMVLDEIIKFLKKKDRKVAGIIYLLDPSNRDYTPVSADRIEVPPSVVLATIRCHAGVPISNEETSLLKSKYGAAYQGDHFGSSDQYETAWRIITRVLDGSNNGVFVQPVINSLEGILQSHTQTAGKGETIKQTFLRKIFRFK
ncbi:hypothetical protein D9619_000420 [Psilocybe cf. subviscida]|uniref:G domain-containing protein n=1 Tax=Psilocybe cf. subviscida TaxID=2480587 RepID=A0A8H5BEI8_9AGAR|nr:hypothetical protein D9619_000420 [Psilocybe cf. subviscida]